MKQHTFDATNQSIGRLASRVAYVLQGKTHTDFHGRNAGNDRVIVTNISKIKITGNKLRGKIYYRHTGYMGHLRKRTLEQAIDKDPREVFRLAVKRMLPRNYLVQKRLNRLTIEK